MSRELIVVNGTTGLNIYALIRNQSGNYWNGSTFEAFTAANYANYTISCSEEGSTGIYVGNFPTAITTFDEYIIVYFSRAGGSPANGDPVVGTGVVVWTGSASVASSTPATLAALVAEGLAKAGHAHPESALTTRASTLWIDEIRADIWNRAGKAKILQSRRVQVLTKGLGMYSNPSDYASDLSMEFATGTRYGTLQAASSTTSFTLAAADTSTQDELLGKELVLTSGNAQGSIGYITAFNPTTKVVTISPAASTTPTAGDGYMILDFRSPVQEKPIWEMQLLAVPSQQGTPERFYPQGNSTAGQFKLHPIPFRNDDQPMVLLQDYYVDITQLDLAGVLMGTLYNRWRNVWIMGIKWKGLEEGDDDQVVKARTEYANEIQKLVRRLYGNEHVSLQAQVLDY